MARENSTAPSNQVEIHPGMDIPALVAANPPNTTFLIFPGTYRIERTILPKTGDAFIGQTPCAPPDTPCPAIVSGSRVIGPVATPSGEHYRITGQTQAGPRNISPRACQPGWEGCAYPEDLFIDGVPLQHLSSETMPSISKGQWWFDYANRTIYFHDNPAGHVVETSVVPSAFGGRANNVRISQITIEEFASAIGTPATIGVSGNPSPADGLDWRIDKCEVRLNHGKGIRIAFGMQIANNYIHDNGHIGVGGGLGRDAASQRTPSRVLITNNTIERNNYAHVLPGFESGGIKITAATGVVIRGNKILHNDGAGIHFDISAVSPLVDGNLVADNTGGDGFLYEISLRSATVRNNILLRNGVDLPSESSSNAGLGSAASTGVEAYCNLIEVPDAPHANAVVIGASNRGRNEFPPGEYLVSEGNSFHHNTVIWDSGARGVVAYLQQDAAHQPEFFAKNPPPDFNTYHLWNLSDPNFVYDGNNSQQNARKTFAEFRSAGADVHGSADKNHTHDFPAVVITSPADQSTVQNSAEIMADASDKSGIKGVEFYVDWKRESVASGPGPYRFNWTNGTPGSHIIAAMAYSNAGIRSCYAITLNSQ